MGTPAGDSGQWTSHRSSVYSLFPRAGDVAEAVNGEIELRAAADDRRADLLVVTVPFKLHSQHVRKGGPLWGDGEDRGSGTG